MKKDTKVYLILVAIILIIIIGIFAIKKNSGSPEIKLAECIGKNSIIYIQNGCSACKTQEDLFGDNYKYLNKIDCKVEIQKCIDADITKTPTWVINNEKYSGVQTIEKLKELTNC
jgi:protein-disulfide isomerase